jgi:hypothetical protein
MQLVANAQQEAKAMADENERRRIDAMPLHELQKIAKPGTFEFVRPDAPINRGTRLSPAPPKTPPFGRRRDALGEPASNPYARDAESCHEPRPRFHVAERGSARAT